MRDEPEVHSISSVRRPLSEDVDHRMGSYARSMLVRTACVIVAIVAPSPWRWIALAGAVLIPMVAVLVANAGRELPPEPSGLLDPAALAPPRRPAPHDVPPEATR